jgi:hypothetical protein
MALLRKREASTGASMDRASRPVRFSHAGHYLTLGTGFLAGLVVAAIAVPHYYATTGGTFSELSSRPIGLALAQTALPVAAQPDLSATTIEDPLSNPPASDSPSNERTTVRRRTSDDDVLEAHAAPKWTGDWQAMTAHVKRDSSVTPAGVAVSVADSPAAANLEASGAPSETIRGCLEIRVDGDAFRLTDTEGANVPRVRNWRSGFLKKQAATVELLDVADTATARQYVGQRVMVTGVVEKRELRVRSLRALGQPCQ